MGFSKFVFYNLRGLSINEKAALFYDCKDVSYRWWADKLDCSVSASRQRIDCSFESILEQLNEKAHVVVIDRGQWGDFDKIEHFEVGFRTMDDHPVDYFLFIEVESEKMLPILDKYNLTAITKS
jgi:hypothetical protein